jgi:tellurite methyltransferase
MSSNYSPLLDQFLPYFESLAGRGSILDLACGTGRNGLLLASRGIPVVFADFNVASLERVQQSLDGSSDSGDQATLWQVDMEQANINPLEGKTFAGIMVFNYLHRPLMDSIKQAICPGGIVVYETFTVDQAQLGRPKNPDFLLQHGELKRYFSQWKILHWHEGIVDKPGGKGHSARAQVVAIKPGGEATKS